MVSYDCLRVPHAPSALSSLQGNRCQQSCAAGFYHDGQGGACEPCDKACATCAGEGAGQGARGPELYAKLLFECGDSFVSFVRFKKKKINKNSASLSTSGAGVEACSRCTEGYLMEEWRCVPSCSPGFHATEPNPDIADGHRICRR